MQKQSTISESIARQLLEVYNGNNWSVTNYREVLNSIEYKHIHHSVLGMKSILSLTYHGYYYVKALREVIEHQKLTASDKYSFDAPNISNEEAWKLFLEAICDDVNFCADAIKKWSNTQLEETFIDEKYGNYYRNISGTIEHLHYHLGQIVIIHKLLNQTDSK